MERLEDAIKHRILLLDGAMGTMIPRGAGLADLLCLSQPDVVMDIHEQYLAAGADLITTCTFNAQRISLVDYGSEHLVRDINLAAVALARRAADHFQTPDHPRYVLGSVGPTNKSCSISPDVENPAMRAITFDELAEAYQQQMEALLEGGVDALLLETIFDTLNAKAGIYAAEEAMRLQGRRVPLMLSVTISDKSGRTLAGQTVDAFLTSIAHAEVLSVGFNCSFGAHDMLGNLRQLAGRSPFYITAYPNAGLPNAFGNYDQTPDMMLQEMQPFVTERLVNVIGGCCGTTPAHIAALAPLVSYAPHEPLPSSGCLELCGLERLEQTSEREFIPVGERCNVAGSRKFLRLIKEKNYDEALGIARKQIEDGAQVIDINMDDGLLDARQEMVTFLRLIGSEPDIARVPVMVDSSDWTVVREALKCIQGKAVVNSISLKEGEATFLAHARELRRYGAAVVVMLFDEEGQATTYDRRIQVCERAYTLLTERAGFPPSDIIIDPNVLAVCTGLAEHDAYAWDFIRTIDWIRRYMPLVHISGGVSNLSFAFRGNNSMRQAMHAVFLHHACAHGMDMAIINPAARVDYADVPQPLLTLLEDVILQPSAEASERLIEAAQSLQPDAVSAVSHIVCEECVKRQPDVEQRLVNALQRGTSETLETDLDEALQIYPDAVQIIEGPLMRGMNLVGKLFGEGKMFLPQVVKTARTMKRAVEYLSPALSRGAERHSSGRVLLATVRGDVHDIGKNIVSVVMACNGYEVVDMGVMVPAEDIVSRALETRPDIIGLSGLITPSLEEMVRVVSLLRDAGITVPVMIGGATTSLLHTALKIAPVYEGAVIWVKDASQNAPLAARFLSSDTREQAMADLQAQQQHLRHEAEGEQPPTLALNEARNRKPNFFSE